MLHRNVGTYDRLLRIVLGAVLVIVGFSIQGTVGITLGIFGLVPLLTGLVGWCPLYLPFGFSTCRR
jgi:hypothetical protein